MAKLTFITGGCRSGKSTYAVELAKKSGGKTAFVATAVGFDAEMRGRIKAHKAQRPAAWKTFEEPEKLSALIAQQAVAFDTVIIDCITVYLTNLMIGKKSAKEIEAEVSALITAIRSSRSRFIIVSNEVGMGIVPATALGRKFRDLAGTVNKSLAAAADRVILMVSGLPLTVKNGKT